MGRSIAIHNTVDVPEDDIVYKEQLHTVWANRYELARDYAKDLHNWFKACVSMAAHDVFIRTPPRVDIMLKSDTTAPAAYSAGMLFYIHPDDVAVFEGRRDAAPDNNGKLITSIAEVYDV